MVEQIGRKYIAYRGEEFMRVRFYPFVFGRVFFNIKDEDVFLRSDRNSFRRQNLTGGKESGKS